jgi:MinD superfamily P-loop ATPase
MRRLHVLHAAAMLLVAVGLARLVTGCSELGAIGTGIQTARDVAKVGCAILEGTDGSSADVLASLAAMQRAIVEAQATRAAEQDPQATAAMLRTLAALAEGQAITARQLAALAGERPVKVEPCPVRSAEPADAGAD